MYLRMKIQRSTSKELLLNVKLKTNNYTLTKHLVLYGVKRSEKKKSHFIISVPVIQMVTVLYTLKISM